MRLPASVWKSRPIAINMNISVQDVMFESRWWVMGDRKPLIMYHTAFHSQNLDGEEQAIMWKEGPYVVRNDGIHETEELLIRYIMSGI